MELAVLADFKTVWSYGTSTRPVLSLLGLDI